MGDEQHNVLDVRPRGWSQLRDIKRKKKRSEGRKDERMQQRKSNKEDSEDIK